MKGTSLGPSDLESPQESTPGDTYIIYFKLVLKCGRIAQGHLKTAQDHLKWTSKQPMHMGYPSYDPMNLGQHTAHIHAPWSISSLDLGHIHRPSQVHAMMTRRPQY